MQLKKSAAEDALECVQGIFDEKRHPFTIESCLESMLEIYLVHTEDNVESRREVYKCYQITCEFLRCIGELMHPSSMERDENDSSVF